MGYFSNGSEGELYYDRWCARCLHDNPKKEILCAVWAAHLTFNYEECNKDDSALHMLIPRSADKLRNERCLMFVDRGLMSNLAIEQYESEALENVGDPRRPPLVAT